MPLFYCTVNRNYITFVFIRLHTFAARHVEKQLTFIDVTYVLFRSTYYRNSAFSLVVQRHSVNFRGYLAL
jgi:hypothetical protein